MKTLIFTFIAMIILWPTHGFSELKGLIRLKYSLSLGLSIITVDPVKDSEGNLWHMVMEEGKCSDEIRRMIGFVIVKMEEKLGEEYLRSNFGVVVEGTTAGGELINITVETSNFSCNTLEELLLDLKTVGKEWGMHFVYPN